MLLDIIKVIIPQKSDPIPKAIEYSPREPIKKVDLDKQYHNDPLNLIESKKYKSENQAVTNTNTNKQKANMPRYDLSAKDELDTLISKLIMPNKPPIPLKQKQQTNSRTPNNFLEKSESSIPNKNISKGLCAASVDLSHAKPRKSENLGVLKNAAYQNLTSNRPLIPINQLSPRNDVNKLNNRNPSTGESMHSMGPRSSSMSGLNPSKYRQYTLRDYKEIKPSRYYTLGGLGANVGNKEWEEKKQRLEKMVGYAKLINSTNKELLLNATTRPLMPGGHKLQNRETALQIRYKMIEYSKKVPKPKMARIPEIDESLVREGKANTEPIDILEKLEMKHDMLLDQVLKIAKENETEVPISEVI